MSDNIPVYHDCTPIQPHHDLAYTNFTDGRQPFYLHNGDSREVIDEAYTQPATFMPGIMEHGTLEELDTYSVASEDCFGPSVAHPWAEPGTGIESYLQSAEDHSANSIRWDLECSKISTTAIHTFHPLPAVDGGRPADLCFTAGGSNSKDERHSCPVCHRTFPTIHSLEDHAKLTGHRPYICNHCGKDYARQDVYLRHLARHKTPDLHSCTLCANAGKKRTFSRKDHLEVHLRNRHTNPKRRAVSDPQDSDADIGIRCVPVKASSRCNSTTSLHSLSDSASEDEATVSHRCCSFSTWPGNGIRRSGSVEGIIGALREVLGADNVAIRAIESRLDANSEIDPKSLAASLAQLALMSPERLPQSIKEQLRGKHSSKCGCTTC
jgi:hypothetical protein